MINGSFTIPEECIQSDEELTIEFKTAVFDQEGNLFHRLPESWTYIRDNNSWYFEPSEFSKTDT
jgi:hypothetical protein